VTPDPSVPPIVVWLGNADPSALVSATVSAATGDALAMVTALLTVILVLALVTVFSLGFIVMSQGFRK